jgi:pilus assembly protein CpaE
MRIKGGAGWPKASETQATSRAVLSAADTFQNNRPGLRAGAKAFKTGGFAPISQLGRCTLTTHSAQNGKEGGSRALLICPDRRMAAEFSGLVAAELPALRLDTLDVYPSRNEAAANAALAQACFLDVASDADSAAAVMAWLTAEFPALPAVVMLDSNDPDLILQYLRQGAAEFLIRPFNDEQLERILRKLVGLRAALAASNQGRGKVFCIVPGKGASGASTIACSLAFSLKGLRGAKVLLADLDGLTGTVAFVLKLKSPYSFVDAVGQSSGLDSDMWKALVTPAHGIDVLLSPENPVDCYAEALDPAPLVASARQAYDVVILDAGGAFGTWNTGLVRLADELVLVTTNELPALNATQRAMASLERNGVDRAKPRIVVNRMQARLGLAEDAISTALDAGIYRTLPNDTQSVRRALMEGKPVAPATPFGHGITALARALAGVESRAEKPSLAHKLLKLFH